MIGTFERVLIENLKQSYNMKIELVDKELEITVRGDKVFAHDVALAFQGLVLRQQKDKKV